MKTNITKNLIIILFLIFSNSIVCIAQSGTCGKNLTWRLEYTTLIISGTGSMNGYNTLGVKAPWEQYKSNIKKIIIEDGVNSVGSYAFASLNNTDTVILGKDINYIGESGFASCTNLKKINFPSTLTSIDSYAFQSVAIDSVSLPDNVSIDSYAFVNNDQLVYVNISGTIGKDAFRENKNLKTVVIRSGTIGQMAFIQCERLDSLEFQDGVTDIGPEAFQWCNSLEKVKIPSNVLRTGEAAFYQCENLEIVDIASKTIETNAFEYCYNLKNVKISSNVLSIGFSAFYRCEGLEFVDIAAQKIDNNAFGYCNNIRSLTLQEGVISIEYGSFVNESQLYDTLFLPSTVTNIDDYAFNNAQLISFGVDEDNKNYSASDGILFNKDKTILYSFPSKKTGGYSIPNTVEKIGPRAFKASKLSSIEIPLSVTEIGEHAFEKCELQTISIPESVTQMGISTFANSLIEQISLPKSLKTIPSEAFSQCHELVDIQISEGTTDINGGAFQECTKLKSISLPASVENYEERIFAECSSLEQIEVKRQYPAWITQYVFEGIDQSKITLVVPSGSESMYETTDFWKDFGTITPVGNKQIAGGVSFKVYPNPADNYLIVENNDTSSGNNLNIFNMNGSLIDKQKISGTRTVIDLSSYPKGTYIIHINGQSMKFIKK